LDFFSKLEADMNLLRRRAKLVLVGLFGSELELNLIAIPTRIYKLIESYTGSINDLIELVSLAKRGIIKPVISNRFRLHEATKH
jgi:propanol-preferring alcohol dehydrogenase